MPVAESTRDRAGQQGSRSVMCGSPVLSENQLAVCGCRPCVRALSMRMEPMLRSIVVWRIGKGRLSDQVVEDLMQDARMALFEALASWERRGDFGAFYRRVVELTTMDTLSRNRKGARGLNASAARMDAAVSEDDDATLHDLAETHDRSTDPLRRAMLTESLSELARLAATMSERERMGLLDAINGDTPNGDVSRKVNADMLRRQLRRLGWRIADVTPEYGREPRRRQRAAVNDGVRRCAFCQRSIEGYHGSAVYCSESCQIDAGHQMGPAKVTPEIAQRVRELAADGSTPVEVSRAVGIHHRTAARLMREARS